MTLTDPASDVTIGGRRAQVLGRLRQADGPLSAPDIAALTGLHISTARFHLDGLVADGLAERSAEPRDLPGRPRIFTPPAGRFSGRAATGCSPRCSPAWSRR